MVEARHRRATVRRHRAVTARALLSLGLLAGFGAIGTTAYWTDQASITGGTITSGSMDMRFDTTGAIGLSTGYTKSAITWTGLVPGESKAFDLTVNNVGDPPFTYTATVTQGSSPTWTYVDTPVTVQFFNGTAQADTVYPQQDTCSGTALGTAQTVDTTNKSLITSAPTVAAGGSHQMCMVVGIASSATNDNQSKTGSLSFSFTATQAAS
ncbi:MAG: SipW-dependent-type signal peptide-containing protein [Aeromicrobium sp.]|uniref:SipW-dependent-type signal peptide-containing protein n=1 Tax=Aeromicrobium sp. TaxID=1871063 RepID=UPI0039E6D86A